VGSRSNAARSTKMDLRSRMAATCLRSMAACSGLGTRRWHALRPGTRQRHAPGSGSRMSGSGGAAVSRATEEREHLAVLKNC
jgi:hypothetical protein